MKHRFGDQYARLESIRTYLRAAMEFAKETRQAQSEAYDSPLNDEMISDLMGNIDYSMQACQDLIDAVASEAAIEGSEKDTMLPPAPTPFDLQEIDPPFEDLKS